MIVTSHPQNTLAGQVALVTGGVRRIGRAIALTLAGEGRPLRSTQNPRATRPKRPSGRSRRSACLAVFMADVTDEAAVTRMVAEIAATLGPVDILINNAAVRRDGDLTDISFADWRLVTAVILDGAFLMSRAVVPGMLAKRHGTIINIGGVTAHTGAAGRAHVSTAKAGLVGLTKALAVEFGDRGITVNCVAPGKIGGPRAASAGKGGVIPGGGHPLVGREGDPEDVAAMVKLLCGPGGRFITGQTIHVSGGIYLP